MAPHNAPIRYLSAIFFVALAICATALALTVKQPFLGLDLGLSLDGQVQLESAGVAPASGIEAGWIVDRLVAADGTELSISATTLTEEPDTLGTIDQMQAFMATQDQLWRALIAGPVTLLGTNEKGDWTTTVTAQPMRAVWNVPFSFWIQILSGLAATLVGGWVWSLNPRSWPQSALLLSGLGLQLSASAAAVYSSRELALPLPVFSTLSVTNQIGTVTFGLGLVLVFSTYPKRLLGPRMIWVPVVLLVLWNVAMKLFAVQSTEIRNYLPTLLLMIAILVFIAIQFVAARQDALARAALRLLGLGVIVGAGAFIMTRTLPILLGIPLLVSQATLFPVIFLVYASVALAVVKYRLFDMPRWSSLLLFYFFGACVLLAFDALLIYGLALDRTPALALSLLVVGFVYLPLRDRLMALLVRRPKAIPDQGVSLLAMADFISRAHRLDLAETRWQDSLRKLFDPLEIERLPSDVHPKSPTLVEFGRALDLPPPIDGMDPLRLVLPNRGHRLFAAEDRDRASEILALVDELLRGQEAYDTGVATERTRIARDLHDNISIHLLSALHSDDPERKNACVRETLGDLRRIISGDPATQTDLGLLLSELRLSMAETLTARSIDLDWPVSDLRGQVVSEEVGATIQAVTREAITNVIRHSQATQVSYALQAGREQIDITICDNGQGLGVDVRDGNGLRNMRERVEQLDGGFSVEPGPGGAGLCLTIGVNRLGKTSQSQERGRV
ncbi:MAG: sensor histidine kinase [Pelagimonas sp.]|uniref:sensor histidine kinase n=1 Tax=Pelagimonas sp. TaxID=2073170 RepID=UPI003D6B707C